MLYGVDVSQHNGIVDFEELKNNGVQFVIVRSSYGCNEDDNFLDNVLTQMTLVCWWVHIIIAMHSPLKERWRRQNSCAI